MRPRQLRAVTYSTLGPAFDAMYAAADAVAQLQATIDALEGAVARENPSETDIAKALAAIEELPEDAMAFEEAFSPKRVETVMRRVARLRGVKADEFRRRSGAQRFDG